MDRINDTIAAWATRKFGSMWTFYAFFLYGLLPLVPRMAPYQNSILYWSSSVQLWALPLLMVGGIVLGREAEGRAGEDHQNLLNEISEIKQMHVELQQVLCNVERILERDCS